MAIDADDFRIAGSTCAGCGELIIGRPIMYRGPYDFISPSTPMHRECFEIALMGEAEDTNQ